MLKYKIFIFLALVASILSSVSLPASAGDEEVTDLPPIELPEKEGNPKLDSELNRRLSPERGQPSRPGPAAPAAEERVTVIIEALPGQAGAARKSAEQLGLSIEASYKDLLQASVPVSSLAALAESPAARLVRAPRQYIPAAVSQGLSLVNADEWRSSGLTGAGVKVAVLDLGFDGYQALLGAELPASVIAQSFSGDITGGGEKHGTGVAEIVYDLAPGATLYLVEFGTDAELGNAVDWLIDEKVDIISASWGTTAWLGDGTGLENELVTQARAAGILWVAAMGNEAQRHWSGTFTDTNPQADGAGWHDFKQSPRDETNAILLTSSGTISVFLKWDDPWGASGNDYDLYLFDSTLTTPIAGSTRTQNGDDSPYESLRVTVTSGTYHIGIAKNAGAQPKKLHIFNRYQELQYPTAAGSFLSPADSPDALSVGAVYWNTPTTLESFSSQGPTTDNRIKPDLVGPDGVNNATYGSFYGTSAATPHVSAAAALVKERYPSYTAAQLQAYLEGRVVDLGDPGQDNRFGWGRLDLGLPPSPPSANFTASVTSGLSPLQVQFTDQSTGNITGWQWNFGDGATSAQQNPSHEYTTAGIYTVSLGVTGPYGSDNITRTNYITVLPAASANFTASVTSGLAPLQVQFTDNSTGSITGWQWNFGDGAASAQQNPSHEYTTAGIYTVSLGVTGPYDSDNITRTNYITVLPAASANFTANVTSGLAPLQVQFTDQSTGNITGWQWDFGDGAASAQQHPSHEYTAAGAYTVSLGVTGPYGSDNITRSNYITVTPGALDRVAIEPAFATLQTGATQQFSASAYDQYNNLISSANFTWSVVNGGGAIDEEGLFTAGGARGVFDSTILVQAAADNVTRQATATAAIGDSLTLTVKLQGGQRTAAQLSAPFMVKLFSDNTTLTWQNVLSETPLLTRTTSDWAGGDGGIAITSVNTSAQTVTLEVGALEPGTYNVTLVSPHTLVNLRNGVTTPAGGAVNMGTLLEGNANNSNRIDITDFGILAPAYLATPQSGNWDARADFNRDGKINIFDFSQLALNFNLTSPLLVE